MFFFCSLALLLANVSSVVEEGASEHPQILLATFGPGDEVSGWWGHIALVVETPRRGLSQMYNYGTFDFSDKMLSQFAMGRLEFWVEAASQAVPILRFYAKEDRDVRLLLFNLRPEEAKGMAAALEENVLPQNRYYLYHHYRDNCATRIRDLIDFTLGGQFSVWLKEQPARMSLREHTRRYSAVNPAMLLLLDFFQNDELDKALTAFEETFLPDELEKWLLQFSIHRETHTTPLVSKAWDFSKAQKRPAPPQLPPQTEWPCLGLGLGLAFATGVLGHGVSRRWRWMRWGLGVLGMLWFLLWGLLGTVLVVMELTDHTVTHGNENLFLANPLLLLGVAWVCSFARKGTARCVWRLACLCCGIAGLSWVGLALKCLPVFDQNNWNILALVLPVHSALALVFAALARPQLKPTPKESSVKVS